MWLLLTIIVGAIVGALAAAVMGRSTSLLTNIVVGIVGSLIGNFIGAMFGFTSMSLNVLSMSGIIWSFIGAVILLAILGGVQRTRGERSL